MEKIPDNDEDEGLPKGILAFAVFAAVGAMSFYGYVYHNNDKFDILGTWGDFVGGTLNPILTFVTFIGLLYTIHLQKRELRLTHKELSLTRREFKRSSDALEAQNLTTKQQRFENTLFRMIEMLNQIVNAMDVEQGEKRKVGRDCFTEFYSTLERSYGLEKRKIKYGEIAHTEEIGESIAVITYNYFYKQYQSDLGHYFRVLYNIFRYIDQSEFSEGIYAKILRAQLSNQELLIIFYNNATERGKAFAALAERFELYDNMDTERLLRPEHIDLASKKSFGKNPMTLPEEREHPA